MERKSLSAVIEHQRNTLVERIVERDGNTALAVTYLRLQREYIVSLLRCVQAEYGDLPLYVKPGTLIVWSETVDEGVPHA